MTTPLSCDECEAWLPDYVLNQLEAQEAIAVAEHLRTCTRCPNSLAAYENVLGRLGEAVPLQAPPPDLRRRLLAAATADLDPVAAPPSRVRWWQFRLPWWAVALTAVNAILFLGAVWWAWQAWHDASRASEQWQQIKRQIELQRQALILVASPASRHVTLGNEGKARGTLLIQPATPYAVLVVQDLPPLPPDRAYQLWLIRDNVRDNGGVFQVDARGFGMLHIQAPYPMETYRAVGITEEPATGSPGPTSPRVIGAPLSAH
jgi:anti-sigma-K factor RskA